MNKPDIHLIALDLDGTLLTSQKQHLRITAGLLLGNALYNAARSRFCTMP